MIFKSHLFLTNWLNRWLHNWPIMNAKWLVWVCECVAENSSRLNIFNRWMISTMMANVLNVLLWLAWLTLVASPRLYLLIIAIPFIRDGNNNIVNEMISLLLDKSASMTKVCVLMIWPNKLMQFNESKHIKMPFDFNVWCLKFVAMNWTSHMCSLDFVIITHKQTNKLTKNGPSWYFVEV